jgi:peptidoglycan lytic transglycosylase
MKRISILCLAAVLFAGCATGPSIRYTDAMFQPDPAGVEFGIASWYGANWLGIGERTADGKRFHQYEMTCAHKTLPLGTFVRVINLRSGRSTIARVTDRGPYVRGRIVDLSKTGAREVGIIDSGTADVRLEVLIPRQVRAASAVTGTLANSSL